MKRLINSFLVLSLFLAYQHGYSQNEPKDLVETFFNDYQEKGSSVAVDNLYSTNKWMDKKSDAIANLKSQLSVFTENYVGKNYGNELIIEKKINDSFVLLSYMVKYDRQPIRFTFQFYKPNETWLIYSFNFDSNLDEEIEEAAKLNYNIFDNN